MSTDNKNVTMDLNDVDNIFDDKASKKATQVVEETAEKADAAALTGEELTTVLSGDMAGELTGEEGTTVLSNEEMGLDLNDPKEFVPQGGFQPVSGPIPTAPQGGFQPVNGPIPPMNGPAGFKPQGGPIPQNGPVPGPNPQQIPNFQPRPTGPAGSDINKNAVPQNGPMPNGPMPNGPMPNGSMPNRPMPNGPMSNAQAPDAQGAKPGALVGPAPNMPEQMPGAIPPSGKPPKVKKKKEKAETSGEDGNGANGGNGMKVFGLVSMFLAIAGIIAAGVLLALNLFFSDYTKNYKGAAKKGIQSEISVNEDSEADQETPADTPETSEE